MAEHPIDGGSVLNEILDLVCARLPHIPADDPVRPHLAALAPLLGRELGHPPLRAVD